METMKEYENIFTTTLTKAEKPCLIINEGGTSLQYASPLEFLKGFEEIRAVTFSSSIRTVLEMLRGFRKVELLIGIEEQGAEINAVVRIKEEVSTLTRLPGDKELSIYHIPNCHSKLYLLSSHDGERRAVVGSGNLSQSAWSGRQEEIFVVVDSPHLIDELEGYYETLREKAKELWDSRKAKEKVVKTAKKMGLNVNINIEEPVSLEEVVRQSEKLKDLPLTIYLKNVINVVDTSVLRKAKEKKTELDKALKVIEKLKERAPQVRLAGRDLEKVKSALKGVDKESQEYRNLEIDPVSGNLIYKSLNVLDYPSSKEKEEETVRALKEYIEMSEESSEDHPKLIGEAITFAFMSPLMHIVRRRAWEEGFDLNGYPVFALLVGTANAGKTTTLKIIARLLGTKKFSYREVATYQNSRAPVIDAHLRSGELMPLLIDEVSPSHFRKGALEDVLKNASEDPEVSGTLILTSNLQEFEGERQILRRACFLPFEYQVHSGRKVDRIMNHVSNALFLKFLRSVKLEDIIPSEDPLKVAREFLLNEGAPVPESYCGSYEETMRKGWKKLYLSSPEIFEEKVVPHKHDSDRKVVCFKVSKEKTGFLTPLDSFDNGFLQGHYLLLKDRFLEEVVRQKEEGVVGKVKRLFKGLSL